MTQARLESNAVRLSQQDLRVGARDAALPCVLKLGRIDQPADRLLVLLPARPRYLADRCVGVREDVCQDALRTYHAAMVARPPAPAKQLGRNTAYILKFWIE